MAAAVLGCIVLAGIIFGLVLLALARTGPSGPADMLASRVDTDAVQAVELSTGRVYFGRVRADDEAWVELRDAYSLRRAEEGDSTPEDETAGTTELVPVSQEIGGDGTIMINASDIVSVQNLTSESPIASQLDDPN